MKELLRFLLFTRISFSSNLIGIKKNIKKTIITFVILMSYVNCISQTTSDTINVKANKQLKGVLLDLDKKTALPYANIVILNKSTGLITNEKGQFSLNNNTLNKNDTLSFQYVGYKTKNIPIKQLDSSTTVYLKENTYSLSEIFIFSNNLNPKTIIKKFLKNKNFNYKRSFIKNQTFIRRRSVSDISNIKIKFKKSSFSQLNEKKIKMIEKKIPKHSISFTDFLGDFYFSNSKTDSLSLKINPIKMISLKDKNLADVEQLETVFENLFAETKEKEYWKVKSGILGGKVEVHNEMDKTKNDSLKLINKREFKTVNYRNYINYLLKYTTFNDKKEWDFLHHTSRYKYTLVGGTVVNGEDVYIIDFVPKRKGKFIGRVYIAIKTYALIRADYKYAPNKTGRNIHLLGVGYSMNVFNGSIYFEKRDGTYQLKYCSKKEGTNMSIDRNLSLVKKKKRFLLDKKLNEVKVGFNFSVSEENSFEILVLNQEKISKKQFNNFKQKEFMRKIYVDQFDDNLWKGYSIIEPTKQMREYKKQE